MPSLTPEQRRAKRRFKRANRTPEQRRQDARNRLAQRKRSKARKRFIEPYGPNRFHVWGGEQDHLVWLENGKIHCDCQLNHPGCICCHMIRCQMYLDEQEQHHECSA